MGVERAVEKSVVTLEVFLWRDQQGDRYYILRTGTGTGIWTSVNWNLIMLQRCRSQHTREDLFWVS
jgi:hypothetical protein